MVYLLLLHRPLNAGHSLNGYVSGVIVTRNFQSSLYQYYLQQNAERRRNERIWSIHKKGPGMVKEISRKRPFLDVYLCCL